MLIRSGCLAIVALLLALPAQAQRASRPLPEVLAEYLDQGVPLVYSSALVKADMRVPAEQTAPGKPTIEQLRQLLTPHGLTVKADNGLLFVIALAPPSIELRGRVVDARTGLDIPAAQILIADQQVVSDSDGRFMIAALGPGDHQLRVAAANYRAAEMTITAKPASASLEQVIQMTPAFGTPATEEVNVFASRYALALNRTSSRNAVDHATLQAIPSVGREPLRAIARLPGAASSGFSAKTHIRGGEEDETLVLFDGMPLFEPFHLKDFQSLFSLLDSRATERIETYTGGFPAYFGDRLSGVINIESLEAVDAYPREIWLDAFHLGGLATGRFNGRGQWLVSARRGNIDLVVDLIDSSYGKPRYSDLFASASYPLSDRLTVTASALLGDDTIELTPDEERAQADYKTQHAWVTLNHQLSPALSYVTLLGRADIDNQRSGEIAELDDTEGFVFDDRRYTIDILKQDWVYASRETLTWRWGAEIRDLDAEYQYRNQVNYDDPVADAFGSDSRSAAVSLAPSGSQFGAYLSASAALSNSLTSEVGLRLDRHTYIPGSDQISPRLSLTFEPRDNTLVRATWGRYSQAQGIDELQVEDGVDAFFKPQRSDHSILGLEHRFEGGIDLRLEAYNKRLTNLRPRYENLFDTFQLIPELQPDRIEVAPERARARGLELSLSGGGHRYLSDWWLNLNLARVEDSIDGVDVPRNWDQRRAAGFGLQWDVGNWDVSLAGRYHSGWPTTTLELVDDELIIGGRNQARLPSFKSLDVKVARRWKLARGALTAYLEVTNLTNADNPCCVSYDLEDNDLGQEVLSRGLEKGLPITPNIGLLWEF